MKFETKKMIKQDRKLLRKQLALALSEISTLQTTLGVSTENAAQLTADRQVAIDEWWAQKQRSWYGWYLQMGMLAALMGTAILIPAVMLYKTNMLISIGIAVADLLFFGTVIFKLSKGFAKEPPEYTILPSGEKVKISPHIVQRTHREIAMMAQG